MIKETTTGRVALWDNLKFLLILLVVIGHYTEAFETTVFGKGLLLFIYAFHMPLFFFISGLFHKNERILNKVILFVSLGFLQRIVFFLGNRLTMPAPDFSVLTQAGVYWFLFALAVFVPLTWLFRNQNKTYLLIAWIVFACFAGYDPELGDFLMLSRLIVFYPFYLAGAMAGADGMLRFRHDYGKKTRPIAALFPVLLVVISFAGANRFFYLFDLFTGRHPYFAEILSIGALARFGNYVVAALAGLALILLVPENDLGIVTRMGKNTLNVYFWHSPFYVLLDKILHLPALCAAGIGGILLTLVLAVAVTIFLSLDRIFAWPLNKIRAWVG